MLLLYIYFLPKTQNFPGPLYDHILPDMVVQSYINFVYLTSGAVQSLNKLSISYAWTEQQMAVTELTRLSRLCSVFCYKQTFMMTIVIKSEAL